MRKRKFKGYHGETKGAIKGVPNIPLFLAYNRDCAALYAEPDGSVLSVTLAPSNPLILDTPARFDEAWARSGADSVDGAFHPAQTGKFCSWAAGQSHDVIVIPPSAFSGEEGYEFVESRIGEPIMIVLRESAILRIANGNKGTGQADWQSSPEV